MRALGTQLEIIESPDGKISKSVIDTMISRAAEIAKEPNTFFTNQLSNNDMLNGFEQLGKEIIDQLKGMSIDAICDSVGTAGTIMGISRAFMDSNRPQFVALEEGIFAGTSTGMNVTGAIEIAKLLGPNKNVVVVACDTGLKYLNEGLFD